MYKPQGVQSLARADVQIGSGAHPIQWVHGVKWPGCEADNSLPSSAKVKNVQSYTFTLPFTSWHGV